MKIAFTFLCFILFAHGFAQINKQQWLIGGNTAFSYNQSKYINITTLQLSPAAGYFFINKMAGGLRVDLTSNLYSYTDDKVNRSTLSLAPFLRYYFLPAEQKINLFADASYGFARSWFKDKTYGGKYAYNASAISAMAGAAIFLNHHTSVEITAGYSHLSRGPVDSTATNQFRFGVGFQIHLGK